MFGPGVQVLTPMHPLDATLRRKEEYGKPVTIGSDVWVGAGALILVGAGLGVAAERGGAAVFDGRHDLELFEAQVPGMAGPIGGAGAAEDVGDLE